MSIIRYTLTELWQQKREHGTWGSVALALGVNPNTLRGYVSKRSRAVPEEVPSDVPQRKRHAPIQLYPERPTSAPPAIGERHDVYPEYELQHCVIAGDLHAATHSRVLVERVHEFGKRHGVKDLLLIGDSWNGDADSTHDPSGDEVSRKREFEVVADVLAYLLGAYERVILTPGNHFRKRFARTLRADISPEQVVRLITHRSDYERVVMHNHDALFIRSGGLLWLCTHQYQYRQAKLSIANELAQKFHCNVITMHQHHSAIGLDKYGRYVIVDCGGLHDHRLMSYVHTVPSTRSVPNNGFVYLERGVAHLLTPYRAMTDWRRWGFEDVGNE